MSFKIKNTIKEESNNNEINRDLEEFQEEYIYLKRHYEENIKGTLECVILHSLPREPHSHDGCTTVISRRGLKKYKKSNNKNIDCPVCRKTGIKFKKNIIVKNIIGKFLNALKKLLRNAKSKEKRELFVKLLDETIGINEELGDGNTALHLAIKNKNIELAKLLLKLKKIDLTIKNSNKYTSPGLITENKLWELINELPALSDSKDKAEYGRLFLNLVKHNNKGIKIFLKKHENISLRWCHEDTGYCAIHYAVINNDVELIKLLLQRDKKLIDVRKSEKYPTPLLCNIENKELDLGIVKLLLSYKNINVNAKFKGDTALHLAIKNNNIELAKLLLKHKEIDLTIKNSNKYTSPGLITENKLWELINELPALSDSKDKAEYGGSFLDMVANKIKGTKEFLKKHKNISLSWCHKDTGYFAIHYAVINNDVELIKLLLQRDKKLINARKSEKYPTPLLCNIENKKLNLETVKFLLSYENINVNAKFKGNTALHLAIKNNNIELAKLLLKHKGIDLTIKNSVGQTPLRMLVKQIKNDAKLTKWIQLFPVLKKDNIAKNEEYIDILHSLIEKNKTKAAVALIDKSDSDNKIFSSFHKQKYTELMYCVIKYNNIEVISKLRSKLLFGLDIIYWALKFCKNVQEDTILSLLESAKLNNNIDCKFDDNETLLQLACAKHFHRVVSCLLAKGAQPKLEYIKDIYIEKSWVKIDKNSNINNNTQVNLSTKVELNLKKSILCQFFAANILGVIKNKSTNSSFPYVIKHLQFINEVEENFFAEELNMLNGYIAKNEKCTNDQIEIVKSIFKILKRGINKNWKIKMDKLIMQTDNLFTQLNLKNAYDIISVLWKIVPVKVRHEFRKYIRQEVEKTFKHFFKFYNKDQNVVGDNKEKQNSFDENLKLYQKFKQFFPQKKFFFIELPYNSKIDTALSNQKKILEQKKNKNQINEKFLK